MCSASLMPAGILFQIAGAKYLIPKAARVVSLYSTIKLLLSGVNDLLEKNW